MAKHAQYKNILRLLLIFGLRIFGSIAHQDVMPNPSNIQSAQHKSRLHVDRQTYLLR